MSIVFAALIEIGTVCFAALIMFAGNMRTTGNTDDDGHWALTVLICGTIVAALVGASHWIGW